MRDGGCFTGFFAFSPLPAALLGLLLLALLLFFHGTLPFPAEALLAQFFEFFFILLVVAAQTTLLQAQVLERFGFGDLTLRIQQKTLNRRVGVRQERLAALARQGVEGGFEAGNRVQAPLRVGQ